MYNEQEKNTARSRMLSKAITDLCADRHSSYILNPTEVKETYLWAFKYLRTNDFQLTRNLHDLEIEEKIEKWVSEHRATYETKKAQELKILYLCGPNPSNDLKVFADHGILAQNIWAIESKSSIYEDAIKDLNANGIYIKVLREELSAFLSRQNIVFDLIYFDACGPFCGGSPYTLKPILEIFSKERLAPLSALITNFAEVKETKDFHAGLIASHFMGRYNEYPRIFWEQGNDPVLHQHDGDKLKTIVTSYLRDFYSDFITQFIVDIGRFIVPNCRAAAMDMIWESTLDKASLKTSLLSRAFKNYVVERKPGETLEEAFTRFDDWDLSPSSYPIYTFLRNQPKLCASSSFADSFKNLKLDSKPLSQLIPIISVLNSVFEGHQDLLSERFLKTIYGTWFDGRGGVFCDVPMPNLAVNAHLGSYGRPLHINTRKMDRITYVAKTTRMFSDYFLFDNCAEFFNWYPNIDQADSFFQDIPSQILARSMIDRMGRYDWSSSSHPFRGSALACFGEIPIAKSYEIPKRDDLSAGL